MMIYKNHPRELTSYDLLKTLALVLMVIDHIGFHFFPDESWYRVIGRLCVPIWFFLIGYARTREIPKTWLIGGILLVISSFIAGQFIFPVTILFTLIATRLWLDWVMVRALRTWETLAGMFFLMIFLSFPTGIIVDYGSFGMLFAMYGWMMRNRQEIELKTKPVIFFIIAVSAAFILGQGLMLEVLTGWQALVLIGGTAAACIGLYYFRPQTYPALTKTMTAPIAGILQFTGRWTLEIYVAHLLIFRGICMALYPDRFGLFEWTWFPPGAETLFRQIFSLG